MSAEQRLPQLILDGHSLSVESVLDVARYARLVTHLDPSSDTYSQVEESYRWVQSVVENNARLTSEGQPARAYYGINTGFGIHAAGRPMANPERTRQASRKLITSHATGIGDCLDTDVVRAAMLIRANTLAKGRSGVRPAVINLLLEMLNRKITPLVPAIGSLGASGDLAPLAHLALVMIKPPESLIDLDEAPGFPPISGEAMIPALDEAGREVGCQVVTGAEAMTWNGEDHRVVLEAKEGLALNNGATFSAALGVLALYDAENLNRHAEIATALSLEALQGYRDAFLPQLHEARGHPGQIATAANILALVEGSRLLDPGHVDQDPVRQPPQDAYSLRCSPQVIGATRDTLAHIREMLEREINAATDNPLIFVRPGDGLPRDYKTISGGNFHGEYIAFAMDHLSIAVTELGSISERRTFWLMNPHMSRGLPSMLVASDDTHIDSGLMIMQYVAAALVSKCKTLSHPDSVDSIPTSADQEDHVSMSMNAALHARQIVEHSTDVIAIELLAAVTAIRHRLAMYQIHEDALGSGTRVLLQALRHYAPEVFELPLTRDVVCYPYLRKMVEVVQRGGLVTALREAGYPFREVRSKIRLVTD